MTSKINDRIQLLELRTKKAVTLINLLRSDNAEMQVEKNLALEQLEIVTQQFEQLTIEHDKLLMDYTFANNRIIELQNYVDDYRDNSSLIEDSINKSLDTLDEIEGLDEIELMEAQNTELEAAEAFTSGNALDGDDLSELDNLDELDDFSEMEEPPCLNELDDLI